MSNYNHIPLTDDSRFSGGVDIGDAQKIKGYYEIFEQFPVHYSLCRQEKTAPYPLCGTVSLRDSQDSVLHMKDSDGKEVPARLRITTKSTDPKEVKREIAEKAQILHTRFVGTGKAAGAYIPIEQALLLPKSSICTVQNTRRREAPIMTGGKRIGWISSAMSLKVLRRFRARRSRSGKSASFVSSSERRGTIRSARLIS